mmetsp:Transcript_74357/g.223513  ORF Transcript_74357/g.223513 Transcript_74357/m.223513 type:complete len:311 (+) Transcript_74357:325-1257(+)
MPTTSIARLAAGACAACAAGSIFFQRQRKSKKRTSVSITSLKLAERLTVAQSAGIAMTIRSSGARKSVAARRVSSVCSSSLAGRSMSSRSGRIMVQTCCIAPLTLSCVRKCGRVETCGSSSAGCAEQKSESACSVCDIGSSSFVLAEWRCASGSSSAASRCSSIASSVSISCLTSRSHTRNTAACSLAGRLPSGASSSRSSSCCSQPLRCAVTPAAAMTPISWSQRAAASSRDRSAPLPSGDGGANHNSWKVLTTSLCTSSSSEMRETRRQHVSTARRPVGCLTRRSRRILITRLRTEMPWSLSRFTIVS